MSWWEFQRVAVVVGGLAVIGVAVALGGSALIGGLSRSSVTLWLVLLALPMLLAGGGHAGSVPFGSHRTGSAYGEYMANDHLARRLDDNRQLELDQRLQMSWTTAIALAGAVLLVVAAFVTLV